MERVNRFEELDVWKKAREFAKQIYGTEIRDYGLKSQIRRASVSVMSNIAEGFNRDGASEFAQFMSIAKGSAGEAKSQLYIALDCGFIKKQQFDRLYSIADAISAMSAGLIKYLKNTKFKGIKYK